MCIRNKGNSAGDGLESRAWSNGSPAPGYSLEPGLEQRSSAGEQPGAKGAQRLCTAGNSLEQRGELCRERPGKGNSLEQRELWDLPGAKGALRERPGAKGARRGTAWSKGAPRGKAKAKVEQPGADLCRERPGAKGNSLEQRGTGTAWSKGSFTGNGLEQRELLWNVL